MATVTKTIKETLTADGDTTDVLNATGEITLYAAGNFGGGTITFLMSYDGGSTYIACKDRGGTAIAFTSDDAMLFTTQTSVLYKANLAGSTTPSVEVRIIK